MYQEITDYFKQLSLQLINGCKSTAYDGTCLYTAFPATTHYGSVTFPIWLNTPVLLFPMRMSLAASNTLSDIREQTDGCPTEPTATEPASMQPERPGLQSVKPTWTTPPSLFLLYTACYSVKKSFLLMPQRFLVPGNRI